MLVLRDPQPDSRELGYARAALERGELVVIPTDTVYGIAALAASEAACTRLYAAKGRDTIQPTAVIFGGFEDLMLTLPGLSERAGAACEVLLPGPFTLVVRDASHTFPWLMGGGGETIGIRIPEGALSLPPLAATSANLPGEPEIRTVQELPPELAEAVACAIDRGPRPPGNASTVIDLSAWEWGGAPTVLRDPADRAKDALRALAEL